MLKKSIIRLFSRDPGPPGIKGLGKLIVALGLAKGQKKGLLRIAETGSGRLKIIPDLTKKKIGFILKAERSAAPVVDSFKSAAKAPSFENRESQADGLSAGGGHSQTSTKDAGSDDSPESKNKKSI